MQRVYEENEWGKVSKIIVTASISLVWAITTSSIRVIQSIFSLASRASPSASGTDGNWVPTVNFRTLGRFDTTACPCIISLSFIVSLQTCLVGISGSEWSSSFSDGISGMIWRIYSAGIGNTMGLWVFVSVSSHPSLQGEKLITVWYRHSFQLKRSSCLASTCIFPWIPQKFPSIDLPLLFHPIYALLPQDLPTLYHPIHAHWIDWAFFLNAAL